MAKKRYLVYRLTDGLVVNCITYDGISPYQLDDGYAMEVVPAGSFAGINWTRLPDGEYVEPPVVEDASE